MANNSKLGFEIHPVGARRLTCAVIEQAIKDFRVCVRRGKILDGKPIIHGVKKMRKTAQAFAYAYEVKQLCEFFQPGGALDQWLEMADLDISGAQIRRKLFSLTPKQAKEQDEQFFTE